MTKPRYQPFRSRQRQPRTRLRPEPVRGRCTVQRPHPTTAAGVGSEASRPDTSGQCACAAGHDHAAIISWIFVLRLPLFPKRASSFLSPRQEPGPQRRGDRCPVARVAVIVRRLQRGASRSRRRFSCSDCSFCVPVVPHRRLCTDACAPTLSAPALLSSSFLFFPLSRPR